MREQHRNRNRLMAGLILTSLLSGCVGFGQTVRRTEGGNVVIIRHTPPDSVPVPASLGERTPESFVRLSLGGTDYELPFAARELTEQGWKLDERFEREQAAPGSFIRGVIYTRDGQLLRTVTGNPWRSGQLPLAEGLVIGVEVLPQDKASPLDFSVYPGIAPGMEAGEAAARLGPPDSTDPAGAWQRQTFQRNGRTIDLYVDREGRVAGMRLINPVLAQWISRSAAAETFAVDAPFWGEDPTTGRILIDGEFFRIPGAVSQFFTSGWSVARGLPSLMPGTESLIQLKRGDHRISVGIRNDSDQILELSQCRAFSVRASSPHGRLDVQLAHSLRTGISHEAAFGFIQIYKPRKKAAEDLIWYEIIRKDFEIRLAVDAVTDTLISIEFKRFAAPGENQAGHPLPLPDEAVLP